VKRSAAGATSLEALTELADDLVLASGAARRLETGNIPAQFGAVSLLRIVVERID
jgi:hypothetical protein